MTRPAILVKGFACKDSRHAIHRDRATLILRNMRRARRITAVFVALLLANLTRVGSGFACVMPGPAQPLTSDIAMSTTEAPSDDMASMPGMAAPQHGSSTDQQNTPCKFPWAPDGCRLMTPCAPLALASLDVGVVLRSVLPPQPERLVVLTPPSAVRAPDRPPPRV